MTRILDILLGTALLLGGCTPVFERPGTSHVKFDDPVCGQITLEIMDAFKVPHAPGVIPSQVWHGRGWDCARFESQLGRLTLVIYHEPKPYRLTLRSGADGRIVEATLDPAIYQEVIGGMAIHARVDALTDEGHALLSKQGYMLQSVIVYP